MARWPSCAPIRTTTPRRAGFDAHVDDLGYALLLKRYTDNVADATPEQIEQAAWDTVPDVPALFWSFRIMVGIGFFFIAFFAVAFWLSAKRRLDRHRWFLRLALLTLPLPWIAAELGWIVAENGRQPWTIDGVLPTFLSVSSVAAGNVWLQPGRLRPVLQPAAVVELYLMVKYIRLGPDERAGPPPTPPRSDAEEAAHELPRLRNPARDLVGAAGRAADRLRGHGRLRSRQPASCCPSSPAPTASAASSSTPSARSGKATRSGSSWAAARSSPPGRCSMPSPSPASICHVPGAAGADPAPGRHSSSAARCRGARWRAIWDWLLFVGGFVPALIFGVAFGNVLHGRAVPLRCHAADDLRRQLLRPAQSFRRCCPGWCRSPC